MIKLLWSGDWDPLFARDTHQWLEKRFLETVDGEFQTYAATDGAFNREHFFNSIPSCSSSWRTCPMKTSIGCAAAATIR